MCYSNTERTPGLQRRRCLECSPGAVARRGARSRWGRRLQRASPHRGYVDARGCPRPPSGAELGVSPPGCCATAPPPSASWASPAAGARSPLPAGGASSVPFPGPEDLECQGRSLQRNSDTGVSPGREAMGTLFPTSSVETCSLTFGGGAEEAASPSVCGKSLSPVHFDLCWRKFQACPGF